MRSLWRRKTIQHPKDTHSNPKYIPKLVEKPSTNFISNLSRHSNHGTHPTTPYNTTKYYLLCYWFLQESCSSQCCSICSTWVHCIVYFHISICIRFFILETFHKQLSKGLWRLWFSQPISSLATLKSPLHYLYDSNLISSIASRISCILFMRKFIHLQYGSPSRKILLFLCHFPIKKDSPFSQFKFHFVASMNGIKGRSSLTYF